MSYLLLLVGLVLIVKGGDLFVRAAVATAEALRLPRVVIGATLMSLCTTAPEVVVSVTSGLKGESGLAVGNAVGSILCNFGLIAGMIGLVRATSIHPAGMGVPFASLGLISVIASALCLGGQVTRLESAALLALGLAYFSIDFTRHLRATAYDRAVLLAEAADVDTVVEPEALTALPADSSTDTNAPTAAPSPVGDARTPPARAAEARPLPPAATSNASVARPCTSPASIPAAPSSSTVRADALAADPGTGAPEAAEAAPSALRTALTFLAGAVMVVFGSRLLVDNAVLIASALGVPSVVIGLTIVAVGTSLPELVTAIVSARKGVADLSVGNLIGANIANWTLVTGAAGVLSPIPVDPSSLALNFSALALILAATAYFTLARKRLGPASATVLLTTYTAYLALLLYSAFAT